MTYIVNRNYPKEFCEWFAEHITHNYMNDAFVSELFMDVLPSYYTQETYGLIRNIEYMKRMNKVFEQLETKLGKYAQNIELIFIKSRNRLLTFQYKIGDIIWN